ncbi:MAG: hypothetical protein JXA04_12220 [Gammaproteobacteria bacterium]|nr:hypothetical protein [Gammaproteobacteria bacterium]
MNDDDNIKIGAFENPNPKFTLMIFSFLIPFVSGVIAIFALDEPNYLIGISFILLSIVLAYHAIHYIAGSAVSYEISRSGIKKTKGHVTTEITWDEDHEVFIDAKQLKLEFIPVGKSIKTTIQTKDDRQFIIESILNKYQYLIAEYSTEKIYPKMQEKLNSSEKLDFGPVKMDKSKLYVENKEFQISQLKSVNIKDGKCLFEFENRILKTKIKIKEIPNFYAMYHLLMVANNQDRYPAQNA